MPVSRFLQIAAYAALGGMLLYSILGIFLPLFQYLGLSISTMVLFIIMALVIYLLGENAIQNARSGAFLSIVVINTFLKLIVSFVFVYVYVKSFTPPDKFFIVPFFIYYLVFTIAETYILSVQARKSRIS